MKLIDLLVQELPELGGWPKDADEAYWHAGHRLLNFYFDGGHLSNHAPIEWREKISLIGAEFEPDESDNTGQTVTREQYETALAASKQPEWDGENLPPVGTSCEYLSVNEGWVCCEILLYRKAIVVMETNLGGGGITINRVDECEFRPTRTNAERKRKEVAQQMCNLFGNGIEIDEKEGYGKGWLDVYDGIAAGKIPGIKLAD